jgi:Calpain family cysteine protease
MGFGRIPGPLGLRITFSMGSLLHIGVKKREVEKFEPDPATGWTSSLQMENYSGKPIVILPPEFSEVRQGRTGNCPVVATLAALAHAAPDRVRQMITTTSTSVRAQVIDTSKTNPTHRLVVKESVLYKVRFAKGDSAEVSGLLWSRGGELEYASSTRDALWPGIFEKAYVAAHGGNSYQTISASLTPHEAMTDMLGDCRRVAFGREARQPYRFTEASPLETDYRRHLDRSTERSPCRGWDHRLPHLCRVRFQWQQCQRF